MSHRPRGAGPAPRGRETPSVAPVEPPGRETPAAAPVEPLDEETAEPALARSTAIMVIGTGLSRVTGLLRVVALVASLGITESKLADTYNVANTTPNIVYELVLGGILSSIFVPVFVQARRERGKAEAMALANSIMTVTVVVLGLLAIVCIVLAPQIIRVYIHGGGDPARVEAERRLGTTLLRMFMPQIVFYGIGAVMTGLLNANRRFGVPMFAPVLNNVVVIAVAVAFGLTSGSLLDHRIVGVQGITTAGALLLGLGTTAGVVAMTLVQYPFLRRLGFRYRWRWDLGNPALRKMARLSSWTIGYVVVNQVGFLVVPILAYGVQGGMAAFTNAFIFFQLPHGIFAVSVMTALLPPMSEHAVSRDWDAFRAAFSRGLRVTVAVIVPAAIGYLALGRELVALLLQHGVTNASSVDLVVRVLAMLVIGLPAFSIFQLALRGYYALQDTRTPMLVNLVAVGVNVVVDLVLFAVLPTPWKVPGLAIGNSVAYGIGMVLLLQGLRHRLGGIDGRKVAHTTLRVGVASVAMGAVALAVAAASRNLVGTGHAGQLVAVLTAVALGLTVYLGVARLLRVEEIALLATAVRRRR